MAEKPPVSPWAAAVIQAADRVENLYEKKTGDYNFTLTCTTDILLVSIKTSKGCRILCMPVYTPDGELQLSQLKESDEGLQIELQSLTGNFNVDLRWPQQDFTVLRYTVTFTPSRELFIPYWPKDMVIPETDGITPEGEILVQQVGTRSGLLYFKLTDPDAGSVLYLQNLTALADYCQQTETSLADAVNGQWPEMGFSLPPAKTKPLQAGHPVIISDAIIVFDPLPLNDERTIAHQFLDMLAAAYLVMPRPDTGVHNWPGILDKGLNDLINNSASWMHANGNDYFNAYVSDYQTPPEIMVQLAVMLPLQDYAEWKGIKIPAIDVIRDGLPQFYNPELGTIMRWLPPLEEKLEGDEPQKEPNVMDSWYLYHPLLNLSRLALKGDEEAKKLFFDSLEYAMKVARHFNYRWPVFYQMDTLETIKAETSPGKGGEKDVAGSYAHIMLQAYELTGDRQYIAEAERAAQALTGLGFELFYQANNTAFAAGALLRLYKLTGKSAYLDLSYLCLANIFRNCRLWDCNYGYGRNFPSFFTLFPLNDAPYTAVYEEQEVFCAFDDYLKHAEGVDLLPSAHLLIGEYSRYLISRAAYYYPPMLPKEMLEEKPKTGEIDPKLWIAVEDLHDGWEKAGTVGQEVYGAGNAFGILPRHYYRINNNAWMISCDYPVTRYTIRQRQAVLTVKGDSRIHCRLRILPGEEHPPAVTVNIKDEATAIEGHDAGNGQMDYFLPGNSEVYINW